MSSKSINRPLTHEEWYNKYFPRGNRFDPGGPLNAVYNVQKAQQDWKNFLASRNNLSTTNPLYDKTKSQFTSTALSGNTNTGNTESAAKATASKIGAFDKAMGGLGAAVTMFDAYKNNAEVKDLSGIEDAMTQQAYLKPEASSREALVNQWNNLTDIKDDYTYKDIRQNNTWDDVSNTLNSVGSGVMAGAQIGGPVGAAIGGVAGLGASIAGIFTGRDKAKKEAERLNNLANWANTSRVSNLEAGAQSLDATDALNAMRNYAAYGGKLYGEGGDTNKKKEANTLLGIMLPDRYKTAGDLAWAGAEFIPYVGNVLSAIDTGMDVARMTDKDHKNTTGDWVDLALDVAGIIPLANMVTGLTKLTKGVSATNKSVKALRKLNAGIQATTPKNMRAIRQGLSNVYNGHFFDDVAHRVGHGLTDRELRYIEQASWPLSPAAERAKHIYTGIKTADAINDFTGATNSIGDNINAAIGSLRLSSPQDNTARTAPITDTIHGNGGLINMSRRYFPSFDQYAVGGELSTHGSDFTNGARYINAGGTHEENPYEGVQMGADSEGTPNLVEEGEVVYDDYVFSDRLKPSKTALKASNLPEKYEGLTFARIAEDLLSEGKERPNDPISKDGAKVMLQRLQDLQESQRGEEEEIQSYMDMFRNMSPEDMQATAQGMTMPQAEGQQAMPEQPITDNSGLETMQPNIQMSLGATPVITANGGPIVNRFANGGNLYKGGGKLTPKEIIDLFNNSPYRPYSIVKDGNRYSLVDDNGKILQKVEERELRPMYNRYRDQLENRATYRNFIRDEEADLAANARTQDLREIRDEALFGSAFAVPFSKTLLTLSGAAIPGTRIFDYLDWGTSDNAEESEPIESMTQSEIIDAFNNNHNSPFHIIRDGNRFRIEDYNGRVLQRVYPRELNNIYNRYKDQLEGNATPRTFERTVINNSVIRRAVRQYNNSNGPFKAGINTYDGSVYLMNRATNTFVGGYQTGADFVNDYRNPNSGLFTGSIGQSTTQTPVIPTEEAVAENTPRVVNKPSYQAAIVPSSQADTVATPRVPVDNPATTGSPAQTVASQSSTSQPVATNSRTNANQPTTTTRGNGGSRPYRYSYDKSINGEEFETQPIYKAFVQYLSQLSDSTDENDIKQRDAWQKYIQDELNKDGKKYKFTNFKDLVRLATDGKIGIVHQTVNKLAQQWNAANQLAETVTSTAAPTIKMPTTPTGWSVAGLANNMFTKAATPTGMKAAIGPTEDYVPEMTDREKRKAARKARREERRAARAEKGENFDPLRYAGIVGNVVGLAGNRLDYTEPEAFMAATANPRSVAFTPIGGYMNPDYMSSEEYVTPLMNQLNANRAAVVNNANGNSSAANAALLAANNAGIGQIGTARLQGKQYNNAQRNNAIQWNSNIDRYNSQGSMQAQQANMNLNNYFYNRALNNAQMRMGIRNAYDEANSANLTSLFNNIANVGRENIANRMANDTSLYGYALDLGNGTIRYIPRG